MELLLIADAGAKINDFFEETKMTALHLTLVAGDDISACLLIEGGANYYLVDDGGWLPLHYAASTGCIAAAQLLLDRGVKIDEETTDDKYTALHLALIYNKEALVRLFIQRNADVNVVTQDGFTTLHLAVKKRYHLELTNTLSKNHFMSYNDKNTSKSNNSATIAFYRNTDAILNIIKNIKEYDINWLLVVEVRCIVVHKILQDAGIDLNKRNQNSILLQCATEKGFISMVRVLLDANVDINQPFFNGQLTALHFALDACHDATACFLIEQGANFHLKDKWDCQSLHYAAKRGCLAAAQLMLERGAKTESKNRRGYTPLLMAIHHGFYLFKDYHDPERKTVMHPDMDKHSKNFHDFAHAVIQRQVDMVKLLLKFGAKLDCKNSISQSCLHFICKPFNIFSENFTIKVYALEAQFRIAEVIIHDCKENVNSKNEIGETPLHLTARFADRSSLIMLLLKYGADVNAKNNHGESPLHYAVQGGQLYVVQLLLKHGADVNAMDIGGKRPLHYATEIWNNQLEIVQVLLEKGVSPYTNHGGSQTMAFEDFTNTMQGKEILNLMLQQEMDDDKKPTLRDNLVRINWHFCEFTDLMLMHLARQGPELSCKDLKSYGMTTLQCDHYTECVEETKRMRLDVFYEKIHIYDLLCRGKKKLARLVVNKDLVTAFENSHYVQKYPIYAFLLMESVNRASRYAEVLEPAIKAFELLHSHRLPHLVSYLIIEQLTEKDLESLREMYIIYLEKVKN